jgi:anti-sigma regulatory factor (Ser/Thr protein kinase)
VNVVERSSLVLAPYGTCAKQARQAVAGACIGFSEEVAEIAQLLTSELVTNALEHGTGSIRVDVARSREWVWVSVDDHGTERPSLLAPDMSRMTGRGMVLVDSFAARWGVIPTDAGKQVWFELRAG